MEAAKCLFRLDHLSALRPSHEDCRGLHALQGEPRKSRFLDESASESEPLAGVTGSALFLGTPPSRRAAMAVSFKTSS